jgi:hypothetical protein
MAIVDDDDDDDDDDDLWDDDDLNKVSASSLERRNGTRRA